MNPEKFKHFCIYLITNTKNQKLYIGQTDNPKRRWSHHKSDAKCGRQCAINRAIRKYGVEFFKFEIIEDLGITIQEEVNNAEMFWIQYLESFRYDSGYNTRMGGNTSTFTSETRKKMSEAQKNSKYVRPSKYTWPNDDELVALINKLGYVGATKHLGIEKRSAIHNRVWRNKLKPLITTKLNEQQVLEVVKMRNSGIQRKDIATHFGVGRNAIDHIIYGYTWSHITGITPKSRKPPKL